MLSGCASPSVDEEPGKDIAAELLVTSEFGDEVLFNQSINTPDKSTILEFLEANTKVKTSSQGGFVESIDGLGGEENSQKAWFYYINGVSASKGAAELKLNAGDKIWWDYHSWADVPLYNAVIGSYPQPFVQSENNSILTTNEYEDLAVDLKNYFKTLANTNFDIDELTNKSIVDRKGPTILIGTWDNIKEMKYIAQLNNSSNKAGLNVWFDQGNTHLFNETGDIVRTYADNCGVLLAYDEGIDSTYPVWLIIGNDREILENIVELLIEKPEMLKGKYGLAISPESEEIIALPIISENK